MSSIIKLCTELPIVSQILVYILFSIIIINFISVKFIFKWWQKFIDFHQTKSKYKEQKIGQRQQQKNKQENINKKNVNQQNKLSITKLLLLLLSSFTLLQPFGTNFTGNKIYIIFLTILWTFMLVSTNIFIPISDKIDGNSSKSIQYTKLICFLSWNGIVLAVLDIGLRLLNVNTIIKTCNFQEKVKNLQQPSMNQQISNNNDNLNRNVNKQKIPIFVYLYYICLTIIPIALSIISIIIILYPDMYFISSTNFFYKDQSLQKIIKLGIGLCILFGIHHGFILFMGVIFVGIFRFRQIQIENSYKWFFVLGFHFKISERKQKNLPIFQESKQNLGEITNRNKIEDVVRNQHYQMIKILTKVPSIKNNLQPKRKSILITSNQNLLFTMKNKNKIENVDDIDKNIQQTKQIQTNKQKFSLQKRKKKNKKIHFLNVQQQIKTQIKIQLPQQQINVTSLQIKPKLKQQLQKNQPLKIQHNFKYEENEFDTNLPSQPILRNIQNKVSQYNKNKLSCKQLKIIDHGNQNIPQMDIIDLNQYVVKDLGCSNKQFEKKIQFTKNLNKKAKSFFAETPQNCTNNKSIGYHIRKKLSYKDPHVPDIKADAFTFCMHDLNLK